MASKRYKVHWRWDSDTAEVSGTRKGKSPFHALDDAREDLARELEDSQDVMEGETGVRPADVVVAVMVARARHAQPGEVVSLEAGRRRLDHWIEEV